MPDFDVAIIGGGVVGLALARQFALLSPCPKRRTVLLEQKDRLGTGISSRSSEVIHAGLYYPKNYLKSTLCVRGRELMYQYCREHAVPHRKMGKLVVATSDAEHEFLHALALRAEYNGITDLQWLKRQQIQALEPAVQAQGAFLSPSTGIVDSAGLMQALEKNSRDAGVDIALRTTVQRITPQAEGFSLSCQDGHTFTARVVVNSAGLNAVNVARAVEGFPAHHLPTLLLAKGDYFTYTGQNPFSRLIYPVPAGQSMATPAAQHNSLGIHATIDMQGGLRFGPDLTLVPTENYQVDDNKRAHFAQAIQRYFPTLQPEKLQPAYSGIRPRLQWPDDHGKKIPDFLVQDHSSHGITGLVNLFGIESPGLTASLALAESVVAQLADQLI